MQRCGSGFKGAGDADEDGYGIEGSAYCTHTAVDCDDSNPGVNPGATEICSGSVDEDCDGFVDDEDPDCVAGYLGVANAEASASGSSTPAASGALNALTLLLIPMIVVILLRILPGLTGSP